MIPTAGKIHSALQGSHSQQHPVLAFSEELIITGSAEVQIGTFGPGRTKAEFDAGTQERPRVAATACLGEAPAADGAYVTTERGSTPDLVLVSVWKSDFTASVVAKKVRMTAQIGSVVGQ